ncbi:MAG: phospholipid carrier-dependent glycosyltransferase [Proteobacteria bacterium]|nr:phospholipid carrier-dependent glycosyltransferase [Pseudomonadota bacterium]
MKKHHIRGALTTVLATLALAVLMFLPRFFNGGIAVGIGLLVVLLIGVLDFFGALEIILETSSVKKVQKEVDLSNEPEWLKLLAGFDIRILYVGLALIAAGACRVSVIGTMGASAPWSGPLLFGLGIVAIIIARIRRVGFDGDFHQGFLVVSLATATIMATLGSQGLWDCWETHYGEVARRQLEQDDWISLFWENKWFYSKPILIFWMMNLGMAVFGIGIEPDSISNHAEWGVRFLVAVLAIIVIWSLYTLIARRVSKRAGMFAALVLGTTPMFAFVARQAITDLPFVGFMTLAVVCFLLGITVDPQAEVRPRLVPMGRRLRLKLSGFHAVMAGYVLMAVPQYIYLATRSDSFVFGTFGHNDIKTVASQERFTDIHLSNFVDSLFGFKLGGAVDISLDWVLLGLIFAVPFGIILFTLRRERRISRLCFHGMYLCLALSVLAKGLAGFIMPLLGLFGFWLVIAPWADLKRPLNFVIWHYEKACRLDLLRGILMFLIIAAPWYIAMILRHSSAFINRFIVHDHIKRISVGVHGETGTFEYFAQQFGYAAFPWVALLPFALLAWPGLLLTGDKLTNQTAADRSERVIRLFATSWALLSFALLSMMVTKFHHYVLPLIPPAAIIIGFFLDDIWRKRVSKIGPVVLVGAVILIVVARDLIAEPNKAKGVLGGYAQLVGLFIYKYSRPYPEGDAFDFSRPILIFAIIFVVLIVGWLWTKRRRAMIVMTIMATLAFSHWTVQHYMVQLAPHWTQKHLIEEYYEKRESPLERLVAFQMNWKGENFYTGNRVIVYVSTKNKKFENWVEDHRGERHFFITEHSRYKRMIKRTKAASGDIEPLADTCNKYKIGVADKL